MSFLSMILLTTVPELVTEGTSVSSYKFLPADPIAAFTIGILIFLVFVFLLLIIAMIQFARIAFPSKDPAKKGLMQQLTGSVPVEDEESIMTDHVYDGIRELDNDMPTWWKYLFVVTIIFAFVYIYYYHFTGTNKSQAIEYEQELKIADEEMKEYRKHAANSIDESNVTLADAAGIESGKVLFDENCTACHGKAAEGGVGPNLTDEFWLHGGSLQDVFKTIKYGIPEKGMISWKSQLSPLNIQQVSSYVKSLSGTNPANPKAPQGDKYEAK